MQEDVIKHGLIVLIVCLFIGTILLPNINSEKLIGIKNINDKVGYINNQIGFNPIGNSILGHPEADPFDWFIKTVDTNISYIEGRSWTDIAIDSNDNLHICYQTFKVVYPDIFNGDLMYGYYDGVWHTEVVDSFGDTSGVISLALDSNDNPHISYCEDWYDDLKYAHYDGSWHIETIDDEIKSGYISSIAIDSNDNPHISYISGQLWDLKYAYYDGSWHIETLDYADNIFTSIALDSNDNPHISYLEVQYSSWPLKYAYYDESWHTEIVDNNIYGMYTSITIDSKDKPHISYNEFDAGTLNYAYYNEGWITTSVGDPYSTFGIYHSIDVDSNDKPHISCQSGWWFSLVYSYYDQGWKTITLYHEDSSPMTIGYSMSFALDSNDNPHIIYIDRSYPDWPLKYAYFELNNCKMHWPQLPSNDYGNIAVNLSVPLADNFFYIKNSLITDIQIYGSFKEDILPSLGIDGITFQITIRDNSLDNSPGDILWTKEFGPGEYDVNQMGNYLPIDWFDPSTDAWLWDNHLQTYQYNFYIEPEEAFYQEKNDIYWLEIRDISMVYDYNFGWRNCIFLQDWYYSFWYGINPDLDWWKLIYPDGSYYSKNFFNLAFVISGEDIIHEVSIDIKPGSFQNSINPKSNGKLPVAILTTEDFNAIEVAPVSIDFLSASPLIYAIEDVDDDGDVDMILHFKTKECDFSLLIDEGGQYPYAYLTGETNDGQLFEGKDTVRLVGPLFEILEQLMERFPLLAKLLQQYPILYQLLLRFLRL